MKVSDLCIWGDNWWIEDDNAWFVCGQRNILCRIDMKTKKCELSVPIPDASDAKFRLTPLCMKYRNYIYCMPANGMGIWAYDVEDGGFDEICIKNPDKKPIGIGGFWEYGGKIYAVSVELRQIIEINPFENKVGNYYPIGKGCITGGGVKAGSSIYILFGEAGEIYQFDLEAKEIFAHKLPETGRRFTSLCFDGKRFWLGGYRKEVCIWDKDENTAKIIGGFPESFGVYNFKKDTDGRLDCITEEYGRSTFECLAAVGQNIWLIPFMTNKIVYINKETYGIKAFEIEEEDETKESILARKNLGYKYLLEYVKDERYIGLYSIKNNCILEIDAEALKYEYKQYEYHIGDKCLKEYSEACGGIFHEGDALDRLSYGRLFSSRYGRTQGMALENIGAEIYKKISCDGF